MMPRATNQRLRIHQAGNEESDMRSAKIVMATALVLAACGGTAVTEVGIGDCFDDPDSNVVSSLDLIDCAEPHDNEVFAEVIMSGSSFPGDDGVAEFAFEACFDPFEAYVGEPYAESPLDYVYLGPTQESWEEGDRSVLCVLYAADLAKLTGSARS